MKVRNYEVGTLIGESSKFRIYLGKSGEEQVVIKVAKTFEDGENLAEEASWFNVLRAFIAQVERMQNDLGSTNAHYDWLFAHLKSSFLESTQQDRRINVLEIIDVDFNKLIPLPKLCSQTKIDARTSVWILGRFLKMYSFYELLANSGDNPIVQYANFSPGDYFIGPERHRLIYYNHSGHVADVAANDYVITIAKFILDWVLAKDEESAEQKYFELLNDFAAKGRTTCSEAHAELYRLVSELWGIQYYPFTYCDQESGRWKTIKEEKE